MEKKDVKKEAVKFTYELTDAEKEKIKSRPLTVEEVEKILTAEGGRDEVDYVVKDILGFDTTNWPYPKIRAVHRKVIELTFGSDAEIANF